MDPRDCIGCRTDDDYCAIHHGLAAASVAANAARHWFTHAAMPRRLAHSEGVARRIVELTNLNSPVSAATREAYVAMAIMHDVGYTAPSTGMHAADGAALIQQANPHLHWLIPHTAWHSTAHFEYRAYGMGLPPIEKPDSMDHSMLWVADFTTSPDGEPITAQARVDRIRGRYPADHPVAAALNDSIVRFNSALATVGLAIIVT